MISRNLFTAEASTKQKFRRFLLYLSRKKGAKKSWNDRHSVVFQKHPEYGKYVTGGFEEKHKNLWGVFWGKVPVETLRICHAISGSPSPNMIPEEIFQADIEPSLNRLPEAHFLSNKSFYTKWLPDAGFPSCLIHKCDGSFYDSTYKSIPSGEVPDLVASFDYPVIMKPSVDSYGGSRVQIAGSDREVLNYMANKNNIVVQELLRQSPETARYHFQSVNTVRVYLYRSVRDNRIHIINRAFRTGNGSSVDNVAAGGLVSLVRENGELNGYALDRYGGKFDRHPVTNISFKNMLPNIKQLDQLAKKVAGQLFNLRIIGLDLYCDENRKWNMLEVNTRGHSIRFAQYHGHPFFSDFTDEVIQYCKENHWVYSA